MPDLFIPSSEAECTAHRTYLAERFAFPHVLALWWLQSSADASPVRAHVAACAACRDWIDARVPADVMRRQTRLSRYCCACMFGAVEEADPKDDVVVAFTMIRDDPCWMIDGKQAYATHCPWCGQALPDRPFIGHDEGQRP
jgi:hypothetical protein